MNTTPATPVILTALVLLVACLVLTHADQVIAWWSAVQR